MTDETVVETDGVRVTKSFDADGFPVPAVRFDVASTRDEETTLTITDEIPDEFDIDQIGFHPEYGSEHWTATGDGVVRFERPIQSNEEFTTVYGVRMDDDEEPSAFLDAPSVAVGEEPVVPGIENVVPSDSSDIVRELAGGERDSLPGLDEPAHAESQSAEAEVNEPILESLQHDDEAVAEASATDTEPQSGEYADPEPAYIERETDSESDETEDAITDHSSAASDVDVDDATTETDDAADSPAPEAVPDDAADSPAPEAVPDETPIDTPDEPTDESTDDISADDGTDVESTVEETDVAVGASDDADVASDPNSTDATSADGPRSSDLAAELAAQIRNDELNEEDLRVLQNAFAPTRSTVQLEHLQSRVSEMEAYADALGAFIDENGDARGLLESLQRDVEELDDSVADVEAVSDAATEERDALRSTVEALEDELAVLDDIDDRLARLEGDLEALDERVSGVEEATADVPALESDIEDVREEIQGIQAWRDQISNVFGG